MSVAIGLTSLYGFPGTMILSQEAAKGAGETPEEVAAIEHEILPKMIIAGFSTVTITSVIVTSIIAGPDRRRLAARASPRHTASGCRVGPELSRPRDTAGSPSGPEHPAGVDRLGRGHEGVSRRPRRAATKECHRTMSTPLARTREDVLAPIAAAFEEAAPDGGGADFVARYFRHVPLDELTSRTADIYAGAAASHLELARHRLPGRGQRAGLHPEHRGRRLVATRAPSSRSSPTTCRSSSTR